MHASKSPNSHSSLSHILTLAAVSTLLILVIVATINLPHTTLSLTRPPAPPPVPTSPTTPSSTRQKCPVILYNKQIKTGSTVISNVLYRTTEHYGCQNAGCRLQNMLMNGNSTHVGAIHGLSMTCHSRESNHQLITNLRQAYTTNFLYLASVREPISWLKSASCFFYNQQGGKKDVWTEDGFKAAVDWMLERDVPDKASQRYSKYEAYMFASLGLPPNATKEQIKQKLVMYDLIIDHARMDDGLNELQHLLDWKLLPISHGKKKSYRGPLYNVYRKEDIRTRTWRLALLYNVAQEIHKTRSERPAFAPQD